MEMCYNGALVMPCNYAVINDNEMEYVEGGGVYFNSATVVGLVGAVLSQGAGAVAAAVSLVKFNMSVFSIKLGGLLTAVIGPAGFVIAGGISGYLLTQAVIIAERLVAAARKKKGVEFGITFKWGIIPTISGTIR